MWLAAQPLPLHLVDRCDKRGDPKRSASIVVAGVIEADNLVQRPVAKGEIKGSACRMLWIYKVDRVDPGIQRAAESAMR
jgi:hypothetical protein